MQVRETRGMSEEELSKHRTNVENMADLVS